MDSMNGTLIAGRLEAPRANRHAAKRKPFNRTSG
jgi:hypothetical protein